MGETKAAEDLFPPRDRAAATPGEFVAHLRAEIDRLVADRERAWAQVRAEQEHNRRLSAACSLYRSAASRGLTIAKAGAEGDVNQDVASDALDEMVEDIKRADGIVLPLAGK